MLSKIPVNKDMFKKIFVILTILMTMVYAAPDNSSKDSGEITISADHMQMLLGEVAKLDGNVLVQDAAMIFTSDQMTIFFTPKDASKDKKKGKEEQSVGGVDKIEAVGKVMVRTPDGTRSATGERGYYDAKKDTITLDGNCTIQTDGRIMRSNQVVYDRKNQSITAARATLTIPTKRRSGESGGLGGIFGGLSGKKETQQNAAPSAEAEKK